MSRLLVLASPHDRGAVAVATAFTATAGPAAVTWLTPEELGLAGWVHTVEPHGEVGTELTTHDGVRVDADAYTAVLLRTGPVTPPRFAHASPRDRDYATTELTALLWSWLAALTVPVVNPPGGAVHHSPRHWLVDADRAGLPVGEPDGRAPRVELLVTGDRAHGPLADRWGGACVRLAKESGCRLLSFRFAGGTLIGVDPVPELIDPASAGAVATYLAGP